MSHASLSVIVPTRDRPALLRRALRPFAEVSASALEVVVVDDGSKLRNVQRNQLLCTKVPRCTYLRHERPCGAPAARNRGFAASRAPFVWFMDDDDYGTPRTVRDVLRSVSDEPARRDVVLLPRRVVFRGTHLRLDMPRDEPNKFERYRRYGLEVTTSCAVFPREVVSELEGWDESLRGLQDVDLLLRASQVATFRCLATEPVCMDVGQSDRITFSFWNSQIGKIQFLRKHWRTISPRLRWRFTTQVLTCSPLTRRIRFELRRGLLRYRQRVRRD